MKGDALVILCSIFWALHIIFMENLWRRLISIFYAALQGLLVATLSFISAYIFRYYNFDILLNYSIIYAELSGILLLHYKCLLKYRGSACCIIYSLEGVFASITAWIILEQILNINNIVGCFLILIAVIFSQLAPSIKKTNYK